MERKIFNFKGALVEFNIEGPYIKKDNGEIKMNLRFGGELRNFYLGDQKLDSIKICGYIRDSCYLDIKFDNNTVSFQDGKIKKNKIIYFKTAFIIYSELQNITVYFGYLSLKFLENFYYCYNLDQIFGDNNSNIVGLFDGQMKVFTMNEIYQIVVNYSNDVEQQNEDYEIDESIKKINEKFIYKFTHNIEAIRYSDPNELGLFILRVIYKYIISIQNNN